jgi:hypothetical protein
MTCFCIAGHKRARAGRSACETRAFRVGAAQTWASGYLTSFRSWAYARDAFDKWSMLVAERLAHLTGAGAK